MSNDPFAIYKKPKLGKSKVSKKYNATVIDSAPPNQVGQAGKLGQPSDQFSLRIVIIVAFVLLAIMLLRTFTLQIISGDKYLGQAEGNRIHTNVRKALRGVVYDTNGKLLVKNIPDFSLVITAKELTRPATPEHDPLMTQIAELAELPASEFNDIYTTSLVSGQPQILKNHIPYKDALPLMLSVQNIPGLSIEALFSREYLSDESYGHIMGYTAKIAAEEYSELANKGYLFNDYIGKTGLEKSYETLLRGEDGYQNVEVDYRGQEKAILSELDPVSGKNLHLSIDSNLQTKIYNELKSVVESRDLPGASMVAIDPRDGSILALVSYPAYDNNIFTGGISEESYQELLNNDKNPLFHRAISGTYPSGSTFKPIVAAAALEEGVITPSTTVNSTGGIQIDRFFFPDWKSGGHGQTDIKKALADSVNTFFYLAGGGDNETNTGLGVARITDYAKRFGLAKKTGIDIDGEAAGFLPSKDWKEEFKDEPWYIGDTYHLAIGQGDILVTPLQVASFMATIANGGTYYQPRLVQSVVDQSGENMIELEPVVINEQVVSQETISIVKEGLREAVLSGSAKALQALAVSSAGKTGTAQFGSEGKTHSWFTAFAPYETPEIAIAVIIEEGEGATDTAVPAALNVLQYYFNADKK